MHVLICFCGNKKNQGAGVKEEGHAPGHSSEEDARMDEGEGRPRSITAGLMGEGRAPGRSSEKDARMNEGEGRPRAPG